MSIPVELQDLRAEVERFGPTPYLLSVDDAGRAHAVATEARWEGAALVVRLGRRSAANLAARPLVSLLWPPREAGGYSLIVDGTAALEGQGDPLRARIELTRGVLHRPALPAAELRPGCSADCVPLLR